jgi:hypothetical protein
LAQKNGGRRFGRPSGAAPGSAYLHLDSLQQRQARESYGVCIAQRRRGGQIWLVLAGVTCPATYAAACLADRLALPLHPTRPGQPSLVHWTPCAPSSSATTAVPSAAS